MTQPPTYVDFVEFRSHGNPCLKPFADLLRRKTPTDLQPNFFWIDFSKGHHGEASQITQATLQEVLHEVERVKTGTGSTIPSTPLSPLQRILIVEDINVDTIVGLGSVLDVDPLFFANYMLTDFGDIESAPLPPLSALVPSGFAERDCIHIHYQQIIDVTTPATEDIEVYKLKSSGNVQRAVRCPPSLSGVQPAIMRGCCSAKLQRFHGGSWLCECFSSLQNPPVR